jgi:hypothetical protein
MTSNAAIQSDIIRKTYPATHLSRCQRKSIFGVGINNADYITQPCAGKFRLTDPAYKAWKLMMSRCYNGKVHGVRPTYIRATVCEEWREFMTFRAWWISNHIDGFHLDKDLLLAGNKEYSPNKCIFMAHTQKEGGSYRWPLTAPVAMLCIWEALRPKMRRIMHGWIIAWDMQNQRRRRWMKLMKGFIKQ